MTAVLIAGKWLILLLGALLALVLLALILPASASLRYESGVLSVRVRVLGLSFRLLPQRQKSPAQLARARRKEQSKAHKKEARQKAKEKKAVRKASRNPAGAEKAEKKSAFALSLNLEKISCLVQRAGWFMKKIFGALHVEHFILYWPITASTAAETSILYGRLWGAIGASVAILQRFLHFHAEQIELVQDFAGVQAGREVLSCKIHAQLIIIVAAGLYTFHMLRQDKVL